MFRILLEFLIIHSYIRLVFCRDDIAMEMCGNIHNVWSKKCEYQKRECSMMRIGGVRDGSTMLSS